MLCRVGNFFIKEMVDSESQDFEMYGNLEEGDGPYWVVRVAVGSRCK